MNIIKNNKVIFFLKEIKLNYFNFVKIRFREVLIFIKTEPENGIRRERSDRLEGGIIEFWGEQSQNQKKPAWIYGPKRPFLA
jgi:hypothetical protein